MKLKKIKLTGREEYSLCTLQDDKWIAFRAVLDAVPDDSSKEWTALNCVSDDLIGFLKNRKELEPKLRELIITAKAKGAELSLDGKEVLPFRPLLYRDFMLSEQHVLNSAKGFVRHTMPGMVRSMELYEKLTHKTFPPLRIKKVWYDNPVYYKGNVMSFVGDGETVAFPKYATSLKDYELELGMIITKDILNATEQEGFDAIGAFCVFNDFSARNVQMPEMRESGFGPCKSKDFASSLSSVVVTSDEILPILDTLKVRVIINGKTIAESQTNTFYHSLGKAVAYASKGERVYAGEFMGSGTIPNCCGMENGTLLNYGDEIRLEIDHIGSLTNTIAKEPI